jgi:arsenite methyltransferase
MDAAARFWDRIADDYAKKPLPKPEATARKLAWTRSLLRPEHRLLDLGCGTGTILLELAPSVAEADGVDVSPAMVAIAEQKRAVAGVGNARFRAEPAGTLASIPDASYDVVCAYNLLHLVPDPAALVSAVYRVLRPGGAFVSSTACLGGKWLPPYGLILPVMRWVGKAPAVTLLTRDDLVGALTAAGFVDVVEPDVGDTRPGVFLSARRA